LLFGAVFALFALCCSAFSNVSVATKELVLQASDPDKFPRYDFWLKRKLDEKYTIQFKQVYEVVFIDGSFHKVPDSVISLALPYTFSEVKKVVDEIYFNITSDAVRNRFNFFQLRTRLRLSCSSLSQNNCGNDTEVELEILFDEYEWVSNSSQRGLELVVAMEGPGLLRLDSFTYHLGMSFFSASPLAHSFPDGVPVKVFMQGEAAGFVMIYNAFEGTLVHESTFGIFAEFPPDDDEDELTLILVMVVAAIVGIALSLAILVVNWYQRAKQDNS